MAGTGALLTVLVAEDWGQPQQDAISERLEAYITADAFIGYPFYLPLLDARSLGSLHKEDCDSLLPDIAVYIREERDENALLIISRIPLHTLFALPRKNDRETSIAPNLKQANGGYCEHWRKPNRL